MLSSHFHCKENDGIIGAAHLIQTFLAISPGIKRVRSLVNHKSLVFCHKSLNQVCCSVNHSPLHHLAWPLVHANHVSFLRHGVQKGILPELHMVPQSRALLADQTYNNPCINTSLLGNSLTELIQITNYHLRTGTSFLCQGWGWWQY